MPVNGRIAGWMSSLESIRLDEQSGRSHGGLNVPSNASPNEVNPVMATDKASAQPAMLNDNASGNSMIEDSEDDLDVDLAKAALDTGTTAFQAQEWNEAEALLQDALQVLQQLPIKQRAFCDFFTLQYRLTVCAYYRHESIHAEQALISLTEQPVSSIEHRRYLYHATHLLSLLYVRTGQIDRARSACEKALQGRRRGLGKHSEASLESTALMAHIYVLLDNRARAKACMGMIPEACRDDISRLVEASLGTPLEQPDSSSVLARSISEDSGLAAQPAQRNSIASDDSLPIGNRCYGPVSVRISRSQTQTHSSNSRPLYQLGQPIESGLESLHSVTTSLSSVEERSGSSSMERLRGYGVYATDVEAHRGSIVGVGMLTAANEASGGKGLSRQDILRNLRCIPVDRTEEAVCKGDYAALASLLKKKNGFVRSKVQKVLHSKRVTALHFAALFGEIDIARRLLGAGFDINEVPELSTSRLTPLKFAIGARRVDMVEFLIAKGAKPIEPDSWATLSGQLLDRSWLSNTMSVAEKEDLWKAPSHVAAILRIWLKHGWNVNTPYDTAGRTLLHQAVAFESGSYKWDSNLRITITRFLCEHGADPLKSDMKGNTPYDMASVVDDQDLLPLLDHRLKRKRLDERLSGLVELSARPASPVELFDRSTTVPPKLPSQVHTFNVHLAR